MKKLYTLEHVNQMGQDKGDWVTYVQIPTTGLHTGVFEIPLIASTDYTWPVLFRTPKRDTLWSLRWHQQPIFRKLNHSLLDSQEGV